MWTECKDRPPRLTRSHILTGSRASDKTISRLLKATAAAAEPNPALHSGALATLGFLTKAAAPRANLFKKEDQSRHKSLDTVADYVRHAALFDDHAGDGFL